MIVIPVPRARIVCHRWKAGSVDEVEIPADVATMRVRDGFDVWARRTVVRRDPRLLLWALGEVERDLQASLGPLWMLALRSSLGVVAERDGQGTGNMASIVAWLEVAHLEAGSLDPDRREGTFRGDALDAVAHATHWLLYDRHVLWPVCPQHSDAHVDARAQRWSCPHGPHELGGIGALPTGTAGRELTPTPVMTIEQKLARDAGHNADDGLIYTRRDAKR